MDVNLFCMVTYQCGPLPVVTYPGSSLRQRGKKMLLQTNFK